MVKFGTYEWLMQKRNSVSVILPIYPPTPPPTPCNSKLTDFSVTTTLGNILVDWGDGIQEVLNSDVPTNHDYYCSNIGSLGGFWTNIDPCIQC